MTSGEARKLLGGYASRTLTDDERIALFEAALKDQGLFDELIREQGMQEVLDDPSSRAALLASLDIPKRRWGWWVPVGALAVAACVTIAVLWTWNNTPHPRMASVAKSIPEPPMISAPAPEANPKPISPRPQKRAPMAVYHSMPVAPVVPPAAEIQPVSPPAFATRMSAPAPTTPILPRLLASPGSALALTLTQPSGSLHAGDEVTVTAIAASAGFLYLYERDDDGPLALVGGQSGLEMKPGQQRLLPVIRIPEGTARVTLFAFLKPEQNSPPKPHQTFSEKFKAELVLDVIPRQ